MLIFRQLLDADSFTYTYLLGDAERGEAVLIDPVFEQARRDAALIHELGLRLRCSLETHLHADHVTGAWLLREALGSRIGISRASGAEGADRYLEHGERVEFGARHLEVRATPGHTGGCVSFVLDDRSAAFTGDALLIRGCGRTDFQQGSPETLYDSVHSQLFSLPDACLLYPGHDYRGLTVTSVGEEKRHNPRLGAGILREDFAGYMANLGLAHPRRMEVAVPANRHCGRPEAGAGEDGDGDWAPLEYTFAGIWELQPHWLEEHAAEVQVLDVREPGEFDGPLGHIAGAVLIPLAALDQRAGELDDSIPVVAVCRSGARSAQATVVLRRAGFRRVANLAGGMLRWRAQRLPVVGGSD